MITLLEHKSSSYAPRTYHNAAQGVTLAYAVDHSTAGEKLTQKAAGDKIVKVDALHTFDHLQPARDLYAMLKKHDCHVVNVAGNGIYTFAKHGYGQRNVNQAINDILYTVNQHWPIHHVVSGGQTGADLAGLIAAAHMDIDCTGMWPKGFKMRFADGIDVYHTHAQVMGIIEAYA